MKKIILFLAMGLVPLMAQVAVQTPSGSNATLSRPTAAQFYAANPPPSSSGSLTLNLTGSSTAMVTGTIPGTLTLNLTQAPSSIGISNFSATGSPSSSTYLRGDNSWASLPPNSLTLTGSIAGTGTGTIATTIVNTPWSTLTGSLTAGGDLQGSYPSPSVNKVQGVLPAAGVANALGNLPNSAGGIVTVTATGVIAGTFVGNLTGTASASSTVPWSGLIGTAPNLSVFSATTSAQFAGVISDETGTGRLVFSNLPTLQFPSIVLPSNSAIIVDAESIGTGYPYVSQPASAPLKPIAFPSPTGTTTSGSNVIAGLTGTVGINAGSVITIAGSGIPSATTIVSVATASGTSTLTISNTATLSNSTTFTLTPNGNGWCQLLSALNPGIPVYNYSVAGADSGAYANVLNGTTTSNNDSFVPATEYLNGSQVGAFGSISANPITLAGTIVASGGVPFFVLGMDGNNDFVDGNTVTLFSTRTAAAISTIKTSVPTAKIYGVTSVLVAGRTPATINPYNAATRVLWLSGALNGLADITPAFIHYQDLNFRYIDQAHIAYSGPAAYAQLVQSAIIGNAPIPNLSSLFLGLDNPNTFTGINTFTTDTYITTAGSASAQLFLNQTGGGGIWELDSNSIGQFAIFNQSISSPELLFGTGGSAEILLPSSQSFFVASSGTTSNLSVKASSGNGWTLKANSDNSMSLAGISGITTMAVDSSGNMTYILPSGGAVTIFSASSPTLKLTGGGNGWSWNVLSGNALQMFGITGITTEAVDSIGNLTFQIPTSSGSFTVKTAGGSTTLSSLSSSGTLAITGSITTGGVLLNHITVQTGMLVSGAATITVPAGCHPWVQDNATSLTNVGSLVVTVSGTIATVNSTNVLDTSPFTLYNSGSQ